MSIPAPPPTPPFTLNKGGRPKSRAGFVQVQVFLHPDVHTALKTAADLENRTVQDCIREAVAQWVERALTPMEPVVIHAIPVLPTQPQHVATHPFTMNADEPQEVGGEAGEVAEEVIDSGYGGVRLPFRL